MGLYDFTFYDLINRNAVLFSEKTAWDEAADDRRRSFAQYKQQVDRLAGGLQGLDIGRGARIAVIGKNSWQYFLLYGAAAAVGAIVLPLNWRLSADEICFNINDGGPMALFADPEFVPLIDGLRKKLASVKSYFNLLPGQGGFAAYEDLMKSGHDLRAADIAGNDPLVIIHTAAVAGRPRGAVLSHTNMMLACLHLNLGLHLSSTDVHLNLLPLFHVGGLFMAAASFHAGALNVNMRKFDAAAALDLIAGRQVSVMFDFAPILSSILDEQSKSGTNIHCLRKVVGIDAAETIERYQRVSGGAFYCMYGQTETSALVSLGPYNDCPGSAGRVIRLADVRLLDDDDRPVARGESGEICVKGPMVFSGYWNLPQDTAYVFRSGWHHTGDLGRFDEAGFLWYAGRKAEKELIKPGGENVYPAEVEKTILAHPDVLQTVVFGVPDPKWGEGIKAVCRLAPGSALTAEDLIRFVGARIASYKKPQYVEFVSELPLDAGGRPDRARVKKTFGGGTG